MGFFGWRRKKGAIGLLVGLLTGMILPVWAVLFIAVPEVDAAGLSCDGSYPCFSQTACTRAGGDFVACPGKCDTDGRSGRGFCYARNTPVRLSVRIGGLTQVIDLSQYIETIYRYSVGIAAVAAAVMIMVGGVQWLTAGGDAGRVGKARERIVNSSVGLGLVIFAYVILQTINPALVRLQMPRIPLVRHESIVRCELFKMDYACGQRFGVIERDDAPADAEGRDLFETVDDINADGVIADCVGGSCGAAGYDDGGYTCQRSPSGDTASAPVASSGESSSPAVASGQVGDVATAQAPVVGAGYACLTCTGTGQSCRGLGPADSCCGGYCMATGESADEIDARLTAGTVFEDSVEALGGGLAGTCGNGMNGVKCGSAAECRGGRCVDFTDYWNGLSTVDRTAQGLRDIFEGVINGDIVQIMSGQRGTDQTRILTNVWAGGLCSNGAVGAPCNTDGDCGGGLVCLDGFGVNVCSQPMVGTFCTEDRHCGAGARCNEALDACIGLDDTGLCSGYSDPSCAERHGEGYVCRSIEGTYICINGEPGSLCTTNDNCESGKCYEAAIIDLGNPNRGICVSGEDGSGCDEDSDCVSGVCFDGEGFGKVCVGPHDVAGAPCVPDEGGTQCLGNLECNVSSRTCVPPPANRAGAGAAVR